ncbi:MAG: creatininase family protein [Planctomycetales bacterium]|nr:creatininase family protein [Planctomycetales bacterium]
MLLSEMKWTEVNQASRTTPIVIPIAALEQHGHHLPVFTDSMLLNEIVHRAEPTVHDRVIFAPLMWLGNSEHHLDFAGTMSASPRTYLDLLQDMVENFLFHGFRRIVLLNGHGGNMVPAQQALFELRQRRRTQTDMLLLSVTYWSCRDTSGNESFPFVQTEMGHACEWETSMIMRIRPDLVGPTTALPDVPFGDGFAPAHRAWVTSDRTELGHIGSPAQATAEKGELLLQQFTRGVVQLLERIVTWDGQPWG